MDTKNTHQNPQLSRWRKCPKAVSWLEGVVTITGTQGCGDKPLLPEPAQSFPCNWPSESPEYCQQHRAVMKGLRMETHKCCCSLQKILLQTVNMGTATPRPQAQRRLHTSEGRSRTLPHHPHADDPTGNQTLFNHPPLSAPPAVVTALLSHPAQGICPSSITRN